MGDTSDRVRGKLKETAGTAANDPGLAQEGRRDQAKGDVKQAGRKLGDAIRRLWRR